jgi:hypothetical protein
MVEPRRPETGVICIVVHVDVQQTEHTQSHTAVEQSLCFAFKYELRIQIHIADQAGPENFVFD